MTEGQSDARTELGQCKVRGTPRSSGDQNQNFGRYATHPASETSHKDSWPRKCTNPVVSVSQ